MLYNAGFNTKKVRPKHAAKPVSKNFIMDRFCDIRTFADCERFGAGAGSVF